MRENRFQNVAEVLERIHFMSTFGNTFMSVLNELNTGLKRKKKAALRTASMVERKKTSISFHIDMFSRGITEEVKNVSLLILFGYILSIGI